MSAGNQRNRFFIVHRHAGKSLPYIARCGNRIGFSIRSFWIHIDQTHLHRTERIFEITITAVAFVGQPRALRTPVDFFGLPHIRASAAKTECLKAHRFEGNVAGENHQISPGDFPSILLLDRPQQPARLVEVYVVRPAIEGRKALLTGPRAAATIADAVRTRTVPGHTNKKRSVVAKVSRPPLLRIRHQGMQVLDHGIKVKLLELFGVIELLAHRIGQSETADAGFQVQLLRPPVAVRVSAEAPWLNGHLASGKVLLFLVSGETLPDEFASVFSMCFRPSNFD